MTYLLPELKKFVNENLDVDFLVEGMAYYLGQPVDAISVEKFEGTKDSYTIKILAPIDENYRIALYIITGYNPVVDDYNWSVHNSIRMFTHYFRHDRDDRLPHHENNEVLLYYLRDSKVQNAKAFLYCEFEHFIGLLGEAGYSSSRRRFGVSNLPSLPRPIDLNMKSQKVDRWNEKEVEQFLMKQRVKWQRPLLPQQEEEPVVHSIKKPVETHNGGCLILLSGGMAGIISLLF